MTEKILFDLTKEVQNKFKPESLIHEEIHLWPIIKNSLRDSYLRSLKVKSLNKKKKISLISFLQSVLNIKKLRRSQCCFFTGSGSTVELEDNVVTNRICDPVIHFISENYKLSHTKIVIGKFNDNRKSIYPHIFFDLRYFINPIKYFLTKNALKQNIKFDEIVNELEKQTGLEIKNLCVESICYIKSAEWAAKFILKRINPNYLFFNGFNQNNHFTFLHVSKSLKIKTIDIQHGKQGIYHLMYIGWNKVPINGYTTLPDIFWTWGEYSFNLIMRDRTNKINHMPVIMGNLWLLSWLNNLKEYNFPKLEKLILPYEKVVLFSLQQDIDEPIPGFFIQIMKLNPQILWLLRFHPEQKDGIDNVKRTIDVNRLTNIELNLASNLPLYALLAKADFHVTNWSTVCLEALIFKKKSLIIHPNGLEIYNSFIEKGLFVSIRSKEDFNEFFNHFDDSAIQENESNNIFNVDMEKIKLNFEKYIL